jgi:hypothetical protein
MLGAINQHFVHRMSQEVAQGRRLRHRSRSDSYPGYNGLSAEHC